MGSLSTSLPLRVCRTRRAGCDGGRNLSGLASVRGFWSVEASGADFGLRCGADDEKLRVAAAAAAALTARADVAAYCRVREEIPRGSRNCGIC